MAVSAPSVPASVTPPEEPAPRPRRRLVATPVGWLVWGLVAFFFLNLIALILSVVFSSFSTTWFGTWLPQGWTDHWYGDSWQAFSLSTVMATTLEVAIFVVVVSLLIGVPAGYVLARRSFPGKKIVMLLFLLPVLIPPITYGIPLATVLYKLHLAGTLTGVMIINLVPAVPFVVLTITPFIEQIDPRMESAARMLGAGTRAIFTRVLTPLLVPGILAAGVLILVRTVGMFELTFLAAGPSSSTLVVALYNSVFAAGIRAQQSVDAMAVIYTAFMMVLLVIALRFINPTQLVTRVKEETMQ